MYTLNTHREAQISLPFALRLLVFQIIEIFGFPIGYNGEIKKFIKHQKFKTSKIENSTFVRTTEKKIRKSLKGFKSDLREEQRFEILAPIGFHVNENAKKHREKI